MLSWALFFLKNPLGRLLLLAVIYAASMGFMGVKYYYKGFAAAELQAKVEKLESQLAAKETDLRIAKESEDKVLQTNLELNKELQTAKEEIAQYEKDTKDDTDHRINKRDADFLNRMLGNN